MKKQLLGSQRRVLVELNQRVTQAQQELQKAVNMIFEEQGVEQKDWAKWRITPDGSALENIERNKKND